jgi:CheY-like chemotaxis protein
MNGQEGIVKAAEYRPDLIIADLVMPVMDGFELIRRLRKDPILQDTCIIASSASVFEAEQCASISAGANEFLPKPISADSLLEMIRSLLDLKWIYEIDADNQNSMEKNALLGVSNETVQGEETIVVPSADTLERLYAYAKKGDLDSIVEEASHIEQVERKFKPFAQELSRLAEGFQVKQLQHFIQQYLEV